MQATAFEYKRRFLLHGLIYWLCFAAPWSPYLPGSFRGPMWSFVRNGSTLFRFASFFTAPLYERFAAFWNSAVVVMVLFAVAGAGLRVWGASYLGASTVQRGGMVGDRIIADGPYRYVRNPLYLGTILHTVALAMLMRPEAGVLCLVLIGVLQLRLIGREEPYLLQHLGSAYAAYLNEVPRLAPSLHPCTAPGLSKPVWKQGVLSEVYMLGTAVAMAAFAWTSGFSWETSVLRVMQGILISLGLSVIARAFIPKASY